MIKSKPYILIVSRALLKRRAIIEILNNNSIYDEAWRRHYYKKTSTLAVPMASAVFRTQYGSSVSFPPHMYTICNDQ